MGGGTATENPIGGPIESRDGTLAPDRRTAPNTGEFGDLEITPDELVDAAKESITSIAPHLTGLEGEVFGHNFRLTLAENGFSLTTPEPSQIFIHPIDYEKHSIPGAYATVTRPSENNPNGTIIWQDVASMFDFGELKQKQIVALILDRLLPSESPRPEPYDSEASYA